ncbi:MAG: CocE/NonD family hydrolase [Dehalococcoidia bacterium]|nr:CocE/NonD family hydrolase [Dehalococcoidia bacterium]
MIEALCRARDGEVIPTLRFNFSGVGGSEGSFDRGIEEQDDPKAAIDTLKRRPRVNGMRVGVGGISFGTVVALDAVRKVKRIKALAVTSLSISALRRSKVDKFKGVKLMMVGERDRLVPTEELSSVVAGL